MCPDELNLNAPSRTFRGLDRIARMPKRVVILGAGFAGLELAARLSDSLPGEAQVATPRAMVDVLATMVKHDRIGGKLGSSSG